MNTEIKSICVYCASSPGNQPSFLQAARDFGQVLLQNQISLVYGGARVGLMGELARTVLAGGGKAYGVIPDFLLSRGEQVGLTELFVVDSMHKRKTKMFDLADAFVALPGGLGTLEEIAETLTWAALGRHAKPSGFLNLGGYYDSLLEFFDQAVAAGMMQAAHRDMIIVAEDGQELLKSFEGFVAPKVKKWLSEGHSDSPSN